MGPKFLAPAVSHKAASFISVINLGVHFSFSLKILAFLSHQSTQHTKIPNDLDPRLTKPAEFAEIRRNSVDSVRTDFKNRPVALFTISNF
jgi:hypothetical protein